MSIMFSAYFNIQKFLLVINIKTNVFSLNAFTVFKDFPTVYGKENQ